MYDCNHSKKEGQTGTKCISAQADILDAGISAKILKIVNSNQIKISLKAFDELAERENLVDRQWKMRIEKSEYDAQLAQRRYEEVDPSNRLVAGTLEKRWNSALNDVEFAKKEFDDHQQKNSIQITEEQRSKIIALAKNIPQLWNSPTTKEKDRKRILRLLIKDITVERPSQKSKVILHIRWQGGAVEDITLDLPPKACDKYRYPKKVVDMIRMAAKSQTDHEIAEVFNKKGMLSPKGWPFTKSMISWVRHKHSIPRPHFNCADEISVKQLCQKFGVSNQVAYYWIAKGIIQARKTHTGAPFLITLTPEKEKELKDKVGNRTRIKNQTSSNTNS